MNVPRKFLYCRVAATLAAAAGIFASTSSGFAFSASRTYGRCCFPKLDMPPSKKYLNAPCCRPTLYATSDNSSNGMIMDDLQQQATKLGKVLIEEWNQVSNILQRFLSLSTKHQVSADDILQVCDDIDAINNVSLGIGSTETREADKSMRSLTSRFNLEQRALRFARYRMLIKMMKENYDAYVTTATFLSNRIPRQELPNLQDIPYPELVFAVSSNPSENDISLVPDSPLSSMEYTESILDKILLKIFRNLVEKNTGGIRSDQQGIAGLLEQGRTFMVQEGQTPEAMHRMVYDTLGGLMTPYLPPFYRIFMSGIVPEFLGTSWSGKQIGPWFYAPWLTSIVTPTFFGFLVGPSYPNTRKDGQPGGLVVEKCKFLQESGCKGLCLHQCKLPAQMFFREELGLSLTVTPNFVTQECQWSFGEVPLPVEEDPYFPKGCLVGCQSRQAMAGLKTAATCDA